MDWMHLSLLLLLLLTPYFIVLDAAACKKTGTETPDDNLMTALYVADPDARTGYMRFTRNRNTYTGKYYYAAFLIDATVSYDTWLKRDHDAVQLFTNLWSYFTQRVVSNVMDIYYHYAVNLQMGANRPRGVIDFQGLQGIFFQANYQNWTADYKNWTTWPYSCFDTNFFSVMDNALVTMKDLVMYTDYVLQDGSWQPKQGMRDYVTMLHKTKLGIDSDSNGYTLETFFHENVTKYIPLEAQKSVFYHSQLPLAVLVKLADGSGLGTIVGSSLERKLTSKCQEKSSNKVGQLYYCKAKDFINYAGQCTSLADGSICLFSPVFQEYFNKGRFATADEMGAIKKVGSKLQSILATIKNKLQSNDVNGLKELVTKYSPYLTVEDTMCVDNWPKKFDCQNNILCSLAEFDCKGGYTCRLRTLYRFDCILKFVMSSTKHYTEVMNKGINWDSPAGRRAKYDLMIWMAYLPMGQYFMFSYTEINDIIKSTQRTVNDHVTSYDTNGLRKFSNYLPPVTLVPTWAKNAACQTANITMADIIFCALEPLIHSTFMFLDAFNNSQQTSTKVLKPNVDYIVLIQQLQIQRIGRHINLQTETYFNDVSSQLQDNFAALSTYFSSLAAYDKTKADADIAYIDGRLTLFKTLINERLGPVQNMLKTVLKFTIGAVSAEIASKTAELAVAVSQVAHPGNQILGGSSILDLMGAINALAQAGVTAAIAGYLGDQALPDLIKRGKEIGDKFAENEKQLSVAKDVIDGLKDKTANAQDSSKLFLEQYNNYDPKVLLSDITMYGAKFETVAEQLCEAAFKGETATAAMVEIGLASKGECTELSSAIAELMTLYEEFYDYQFDLMDSLSDAARAYLAYEKANEMKLIYTKGPRVDQAFLRNTAVNTFMVSTLNVWQIVTEYCDILTYTSGGAVPTKCSTALTTPSHVAVAEVLAYRPDPLCNTNNEVTDYMEIPIKKSSSGDTAYIDLDKLYKRESVTFKVPNFQWLKDHGWVGNQDSNKAIYIKRFEVFLPPMAGSGKNTIEVTAAPGLRNYLTPGGTKYQLDLSAYTARYTENNFNCYNPKVNSPYALCRSTDLAQLCVTSNGYVNRKIQPSIFNEWSIKATALPVNETPPKPVTNFKLQVGITTCMVNLSARKKRGVLRAKPKMVRRKREVQHCCSSTQYWNGAACTSCPAGSSQKLKGYYCQ